MVLSRLNILAGVSSGAGIAIYGYEDWKSREVVKLRHYCEELSKQGYLKLPSSIRGIDKRLSWDNILKPKMMSHFRETYPKFNLENRIWPEPENGKNYQFTLRDNGVAGLPHVFQNNYLVQAILSYYCSPDLLLIHYGDQTCFKLKALISPTWAFASLILPRGTHVSKKWGSPPSGMFEFRGDDQSWHITNLPNNKYGRTGKALPWASHFDAGIENIFTRGIPGGLLAPRVKENKEGEHKFNSMGMDKADAERTLIRMALHQLAIVFYCDTPGSLTAKRGATGFYPGSHLIVNKSIKEVLLQQGQLSWQFMGYALREVFRDDATTKRDAEGNPRLIQPVLEEDEILLALGTTVHSSMFAVELMDHKQPRVIQNCKVSAAKFSMTHSKQVSYSECTQRQKIQDEFIDRVPKNSLLFQNAAHAAPSPTSRQIVDEYVSYKGSGT